MERRAFPMPAAAVVAAALAALAPLRQAHAAPGAATPSPAVGSIYTCRDEQGRAYTADRPLAECSRTTIRELRPDGSTRRELAAPLTPEQRRRQEAEQQRRLAEESARREQEQRDRALLITYPDESRLEQMRARALEGPQRQVDEIAARMVARHRELLAAQRQARAEALRRRDRDASAEVRELIQQAASDILADNALLMARQEDIARIDARFDADRARLRELLSVQGVAERAVAARR